MKKQTRLSSWNNASNRNGTPARRLLPLVCLVGLDVVTVAFIPVEIWMAITVVTGLLSLYLYKQELFNYCKIVLSGIVGKVKVRSANSRLQDLAREVCHARDIMARFVERAGILIEYGEPVPWEPIRSRLVSISVKLDVLGIPHPSLPSPAVQDNTTLAVMYRWLDYLNLLAPMAELDDLDQARRIAIASS